jgi:hypothetical protein
MGVNERAIENLVNTLRKITPDETKSHPIPTSLPTTYLFFADRQSVYEFIQKDLAQLSHDAPYSGAACPQLYATLQAISQICP